MGGIKAHNLEPLLEHGARKIAVVTALTGATDIAAAARAMIEAIRRGRMKKG
jgi:thiamine monophosphate synthase